MKISRFNYIAILALVLGSLAFIDGCGSKDRLETAPDGSTITFSPTGHTQAGITAPTCATFAITLRYPDQTPFPRGVVTIYGPFAEPRNATNNSPRYQFYSAANCNLPGASGAAVNSGFQGQTDVKGVYTFSALIYDVITVTTPTGPVTGTNIFKDSIEAHSGTAFGSADIAVTQ